MDDTRDLSIQLLGPVELRAGQVDVGLGGAKQRTVLAVLALSPSRVVPAEHVVAAVWGEDPPDRANATLQVYVSNLRRAIAAVSEPVLKWQAPGYVLMVGDGQVDLGRFRSMTARAKAQHAAGANAAAADTLRDALALWQGEALGGLSREGVLARHVRTLENERRAALELRLDIELDGGRSRELIPELSALVDASPLDEGLAARLITAFYRAGRQADAFTAYARVRGKLADELGVDPGPQLRQLEAALLAQADDLLGPSPALLDSSRRSTLRWTPSVPSAWLVQAGGQRVPLGETDVVLGRAEECEVVLAHASVSRRHCVIARAADGGHVLTDLGSTNGTTLNGASLQANTPAPLSHGDEIGAGAIVGTYHVVGPAPAV